jgi:dihydrolipoamide dehydrogenase
VTNDGSQPRLAVIGAGPGGYPAAFHAAELGMDVTLIDPEANPGGVCLYRGCIPSKTLLHVASLLGEVEEAAAWGVQFGQPEIDLERLRSWKDLVISRMTGGLGLLARARRVRCVQGWARFEGPGALDVKPVSGGEPERVDFDYAVVATGSQPAAPPGFEIDGERVLDSTSALELADVPETLLVVGGGYIGLELGSVYAALGSRVSVVEMETGLLPGADRDLLRPLERKLESTFAEILLSTRVANLDVQPDGVDVELAGARVENRSRSFDKVLVAVGRRPNSAGLGLDSAGVELDGRGFIKVDHQRRTTAANIFAIGDVAGEPMLAHKATYEAHVAAAAIAGHAATYDAQAIPAVVFTDPEIAWCGLTESEARESGRPHEVARFPWAASGRATTLGRNDGLTKLILEPTTERVLGVGITGTGAGELIAEGVLAVEMGARADDLRLSIHPHPTTSETLMEAAEVFFNTSPHYIARPRG